KIPRNAFGDLVCRLAVVVEVHLDRSGGVRWVELNKRCVQPKFAELPPQFIAQSVAARAARHHSLLAEERRHIREICGRAAELLTLRQQVPQNFAEPDRDADFFGHMSLIAGAQNCCCGLGFGSGLRGTISSRLAVRYTNDATITAICFMSGS